MSERSATVLLRSALPALPERLPRITRQAIEEPPEQRVLFSYVLSVVSACLVVLLLSLTVVGQFQHYLDQRRLYKEFRVELAAGSLPLGQTDYTGKLVKPGSPIAQISIPSIGVNQIVVEGSTSFQTMEGVGHRRDTPLPGQAGVSVLFGRAAAFGGVFKHLADLKPGAEIDVLTGQGRSTYKVIGVRGKTSQVPVLGAGDGRLTLATASGGAYRPSGVTLVDAQLTSTASPTPGTQPQTTAFPAEPLVLGTAALSGSENVLAGDRSHAFALSWLLLLLVLLLAAAIWSWERWGKPATWLVFVPILAVVGLVAANAICGMLPNLM